MPSGSGDSNGSPVLLLYSLVGVVVFAAVMSCVMAPILRRVLHAFHADVAE